jgi:hypothetical protein
MDHSDPVDSYSGLAELPKIVNFAMDYGPKKVRKFVHVFPEAGKICNVSVTSKYGNTC